MRKQLLVLSFSDLRTDPRVGRQLDLLSPRFDVTAVGFGCPAGLPIRCITVPDRHWGLLGKIFTAALLKTGRLEAAYGSSRCVRAARDALRGSTFDLILANDLGTLPLACRLASRHGVIFDAHEYSPREYEDLFFWRFFFQRYNDYLCRTYLPRVNGMLTVCQGIADEYEANYGVKAQLLLNAPPYHDLAPRRTDPGRIRMVHHGNAIPSRKTELMMETMDFVDERFHLDLMLVPGAPGYLEKLGRLASGRPRVRIVPPVPMTELPRHLNQYDIGVFLLPPATFTYRFALPNKFFEFIQARLAVAIGPSPEMERQVRHYDCGIVSEDFSPRSLARALNQLDAERIDYFKQRSDLAARELCFDKSAPVLLDMIDRLVKSD